MNENRKKLLISLQILIIGSFVSIYLSSALHFILSGKMNVLRIIPIKDCISSIITVNQHRMLFLCIQGFVALLCILYYTANNKPYQSKLREITPKIRTPVPVGQKQHGSAEWLTENEKDTAFENTVINLRDRYIKRLLYEGCQYDTERPPDIQNRKAAEEAAPADIWNNYDSQKQDSYLKRGGIVSLLNAFPLGSAQNFVFLVMC